MKWAVTTAPATQPVTWAEAKAHLRLSSDAERGHVETLIKAASDYAAELMGTSLVSQGLTATFYAADGSILKLPRGPVTAIASVTDKDGTTLATTAWEWERRGHTDLVILKTSPARPLVVVYTAGYATAADVPPMVRVGILNLVGSLYESRESTAEKTKVIVPHNAEAFFLLRGRVPGVG